MKNNPRAKTRKAAVGLIGVMSVLIATFDAYSLWSRSGAPSFSQGGAFAQLAAPASGPNAGARASAEASTAGRATTAGAGARASAEAPTTGPATTTTAAARASAEARPRVTSAGVGVNFPRPGEYTYRGSGSEKIEFGGNSPCSWELGTVKAVFNREGDHMIKDVTYSEQRQERVIFDYQPEGIYTTFVGAAVTCLGVRHKTEETYDPPALRTKLPLKQGTAWHSTARTPERSEDISGKVLARTTLRVPAGTFDTFKVQIHVTISGNQQGTYDTTFWFSPDLGLSVKQIERTDVRASGAYFFSDVTTELASVPA